MPNYNPELLKLEFLSQYSTAIAGDKKYVGPAENEMDKGNLYLKTILKVLKR